MGLAALIGMVTPFNVLIGYDCSVHMCKLSPNPYGMCILTFKANKHIKPKRYRTLAWCSLQQSCGALHPTQSSGS